MQSQELSAQKFLHQKNNLIQKQHMEEATPELNPELNNHYTPKPIPFVEKNDIIAFTC